MIDLTEKLKKDTQRDEIEIRLALTPSFEEWQRLLSDRLAKIEGEEINAELEARLKKTQELELELRKENAKLKELLENIRDNIANSELKLTPRGFDLICKTVRKIDEVLK